MVLLLQTARAASGTSCLVSGKIPLFLKVMQAARMQIILNTRQARIALLSHSADGIPPSLAQRAAACQVIFWLVCHIAKERKAPGAKSGFAFPGTSALYVTLTQIPATLVCVCVYMQLFASCLFRWPGTLEGLIMRSETPQANTLLRAQRAARPIGCANSDYLFSYTHTVSCSDTQD
jgi:hypothetical protein